MLRNAGKSVPSDNVLSTQSTASNSSRLRDISSTRAETTTSGFKSAGSSKPRFMGSGLDDTPSISRNSSTGSSGSYGAFSSGFNMVAQTHSSVTSSSNYSSVKSNSFPAVTAAKTPTKLPPATEPTAVEEYDWDNEWENLIDF